MVGIFYISIPTDYFYSFHITNFYIQNFKLDNKKPYTPFSVLNELHKL